MKSSDVAALALEVKRLVDLIPGPVLEPIKLVLEGLLADDAGKQRRSLALATARAHKAAVEAMIKKTTGR